MSSAKNKQPKGTTANLHGIVFSMLSEPFKEVPILQTKNKTKSRKSGKQLTLNFQEMKVKTPRLAFPMNGDASVLRPDGCWVPALTNEQCLELESDEESSETEELPMFGKRFQHSPRAERPVLFPQAPMTEHPVFTEIRNNKFDF